MKRRISILFIFMLLLQTFTSSMILPAQILAEGGQQSENSIIDDVTVTDKDGNLLDVGAVEETTDATVTVDWSVANADVEEGNTDFFTLSPALTVEGTQTGELTNGEVAVGTYEAAENGVVTVSVDEAAAENTRS